METLNIQQTKSSGKGALWTGRVLFALVVLFLLMDALMKVFNAAPSVEGSDKLGWPVDSVQSLGIVLLVSTIFYIIPRTVILGAILLTAYLGGATAIMVRVGEPFFFPVIFGVLVWGAIFLRDEKLRTLIPFRKED
jgi:uncharacterized BrkB/YihY/UPF0761 family membrane protein